MMDLFGWDGAVPKLRTNRTDPIRSRELRIESWALGTGIQELGTEAKPRLMVQLAKWLRLWVRQPCGLGANMLSGDLEMEMVRQMADGRWEWRWKSSRRMALLVDLRLPGSMKP